MDKITKLTTCTVNCPASFWGFWIETVGGHGMGRGVCLRRGGPLQKMAGQHDDF